jgi:protein-tyrosine phosphatase
MAVTRNMKIDATQIIPGLYQGSIPIPGYSLKNGGFDTLVLCAKEYQPPSVLFPGLKVIHAPNDDSGRPLTDSEKRIALVAADITAKDVASGKNVLVTCMQGRNRSGLVVAIAVVKLTGMQGDKTVRLIQQLRKNALTNPSFCEFLES